MTKPFCSTCGKDVHEVLCPTCAKWWNDNPLPATDEALVDDVVFTLARHGCIKGLPISDTAKAATLAAMQAHITAREQAARDKALDEAARYIQDNHPFDKRALVPAILALKEQSCPTSSA